MGMNHTRLILVGGLVLLYGCASAKDDGDTVGDASTTGAAPSSACYVALQYRCKEYPEATPEQVTNLRVECQAEKGQLSQNPGTCPSASFLGKCTVGTGKGREINRAYYPADVENAKAQCAQANGVWSTTF